MTTRNNPRPNAFRHPHRHDVITNLRLNPHEIARPNPKLRRMTGVDPEWVRVRDLVEPFRVRTARVNLHREPKRRDQNRLIRFEIVFVNVTLEVNGYREL